MTFADRLGFDIRKGDALHAVDVIPGVNPPEPRPIKPGDWVVLRFQGKEIDADVTAAGDDIEGVVRTVSPDLSAQLEGLGSGQEITFREPHVFVVHPS